MFSLWLALLLLSTSCRQFTHPQAGEEESTPQRTEAPLKPPVRTDSKPVAPTPPRVPSNIQQPAPQKPSTPVPPGDSPSPSPEPLPITPVPPTPPSSPIPVDLKVFPAISRGLIPVKFTKSKHINDEVFSAFVKFLTTKYNIEADGTSPIELVIASAKESVTTSEIDSYFSAEQKAEVGDFPKTLAFVLIIETTSKTLQAPREAESYNRSIIVYKAQPVAPFLFVEPVVGYFRLKFVAFENMLKHFGITDLELHKR